MEKENVVNEIKCFPGRLLSGVSRLFVRLVNRETTLLYQQHISGRSRIKCGRTPLFDNAGFTLIELLVVVLIIGILASVALPQYQKAVWKSRATEMSTILQTVAQAEEAYGLANGDYTDNWDELAVDISLAIAETSPCNFGAVNSRRQKGSLSFAISHSSSWTDLVAAFNEGPYECGGFVYNMKNSVIENHPKGLYCFQYSSSSADAKQFCQKVLGATTYVGSSGGWKRYQL